MPTFSNSVRRITLGAIATFLMAGAALAGDITIVDAYARSSSKSGAVFMQIINSGDTDDRLISASSSVSKMVGLHTHIEDANGVMMMREVEGGFLVSANDQHLLERGGDHVMLMGLKAALEDGGSVDLILTFEKAGEITLTVPVDLDR
jgi:periplasmic copper chaperone A